jgi:ferric-dicitrate binding protein FerR (iron transport regulator)
MKENILRALLYKYFYDELNESELEELRSIINGTPDEIFKREVDFIWEHESYKIPIDPTMKSEILQSIHSTIGAEKVVIKKTINWWKVAAIIMLPIMVIGLSLFLFDNKKDDVLMPQEYVIFSENGQKSQVILPDGTHVCLNSGSEITYTSDFNQTNRNIKLKGEAFFDVKKSASYGFTVEVNSIDIQVLGTAFNVSAYDEDPDIKVSLERGKVEVRQNKDKQLLAILNPNEQVSVNKTNLSSSITKCDAQIESIWHKNILRLNNVTEEEMFRKLERWYGVNITVQNLGKPRRYGFTIKDESLREMLELINIITPISYRIEGEEVTIKYK